MNATPATTRADLGGRRADLDWIRVAAFALLILFHVGLVYGPNDWHIRSTHIFNAMPEALLLTGPWRLTVLFLVSGAAMRFISVGKGPGELARARLVRLGPPLAFGVLALVPVQSWIEAMDKGSWTGSLPQWLGREFGLSGLANGVPVNHLWFLVYVAAYSIAAVYLLADQSRLARWEAALRDALPGWRILAVPFAYLAAIRVLVFPLFGITNQIHWDFYNHALSFGAFLFGYLLVGQASVWTDLERFRRPALTIAVLSLPVVMLQSAHPGGAAFLGVPRALVFALYQWAAIAAVLGYASRRLRGASGPVLTYLNQAVLPCYLAHQTILVLAVWLLKPAHLPAPAEALLLVVVTFAGSLVIYEAVRRLPGVRTLWGLKAPRGVRPGPFHPRPWLAFGVAAPVAAFTCVALAMASYPGFNHATQYLSELGGATAATPGFFNAGVLAAGLMAALAGAGFGLSMVSLTGARITGGLTATAFALAGAGLVTSALFPWPDPRHMAINLGLGIQIAPLLLLWGLRGRADLAGLRLFLAVTFVVMAALTVITKHLVFPGLVNDANVGWWERAYATILVGWVAVAAIALERRLKIEDSAPVAA